MQAYERYLVRWRSAGLLDDAAETAIRRFEVEQERPSGRRWQAVLALVLGGILLGAGMLLFVAAHWEDVSPGTRLAMVMAMLGIFRGAGIAASERFPGFATAMHALGTVGCGAAIALIGQIFNMQEHWPAAVMLWAICAAAGWWLLGDQLQQTATLLLVPAWIICEWSERANVYSGSNIYLARMIAVAAAVYLTAFAHSRRRVVRGILFGVAGVALAISTVLLTSGFEWRYYGYGHDWGFVPVSMRLVALAIVAISGGLAWWTSPRSLLPVGAVTATTFVLPWLRDTDATGPAYRQTEPMVAMYGVVAAACVFLAWWGVREASRAIVNYAIATFALTVMWFYFSDIMGKLDRSLGLILLGVLFLAGGWGLEMARRRLVGSIEEVAA